jgi:CRP-like cAMP-binding protein
MISVQIDEVKEGMILGEDLIQGSSILFPKNTVMSKRHITRLKKLDFSEVWIDDSAEQEKKIQKKAPKAVSGLSKRVYKGGQYVCIQGEASEALYILVEGELDVIYTDDTLFTPEMVAVDKLPIIEKDGKKISSIKGKMINFGELGALLGDNRTATIMASEESIVASIPAVGESFNNTILKNARLGLNISITIAKRLKDINVYISKYNNILSQVDNMVREFSSIYVTVAQRILQQAIATRMSELEEIHEEIKKSPLYNRLFKYQKQSIDAGSMGSGRHVADIDDDSFFSYGNIIAKKPGENICYQGEVGDKMYVLVVGKMGVFVGDKMVASYENKGDIIGEVSVLLGYASHKSFDKRTATVKAISRTRLMVIEVNELDGLVKNNPKLVLHITKTLADRLKASNQVFIDAQKGVNEYLNKLHVKRGSCGYEIERVLQMFSENINAIDACANEVKVMKKISEAIQSKYTILKEQLASM